MLKQGNQTSEAGVASVAVVIRTASAPQGNLGIGISDHEEQALTLVGALPVKHRHLVTDPSWQEKVIATVVADDFPADILAS